MPSFSHLTSAVTLDKKDGLKIGSYRLAYHAKYGSPKIDEKSEVISNITVKGNTLTIELKNKPVADRVYALELTNATGTKLGPISAPKFWYSAHKVYK